MCTQWHFWLVFTVILTILNNTRQCFYQSKTVNSFWPVNVLTTRKVRHCLAFKCARSDLGKYINISSRREPLRFGGRLNTQFFFRPPIGQRVNTHSVFLRVLPEAMSTRHSWLWQTLDDVYTRRCFSESEGTRFGAPGQKALPSVNEFTLLWIFA